MTSAKAILELVAAGKLSPEQAAEQLKGPTKPVSFKVSEKGGVSIYGLQRFPVTLYASQWMRILDAGDGLHKFIVENKATLTTK